MTDEQQASMYRMILSIDDQPNHPLSSEEDSLASMKAALDCVKAAPDASWADAYFTSATA
jgi:hypothetical protein